MMAGGSFQQSGGPLQIFSVTLSFKVVQKNNNLHFMVVAGVCFIEIRIKLDTLTHNEEKINDDEDSCHISFFSMILCSSGKCLGRVLGGDDETGVENGDDNVRTEFNKYQLHPEHVDSNVGGILIMSIKCQVNFAFKNDI